MTVIRRWLMATAGGSGSFLAAETATPMASSPHGGWTQGQGPHAVYNADYGYVAGVNGTTYELEVYGVHLTDGTAVTPIVVHAALTNDTHDAPSLLVRDSDHRLMVWYSGHNGTHFWQRISVNSLDSDPTLSGGFGSEVDLDSTFGGSTYTYPFAGQFADGTLWLGFRDEALPNSYLCLAKSTDDGATWTAETKVWNRSGHIIYWHVHYSADRIDMAVADDNGVTGTDVSLYHSYLQGGGNPHLSDGTSMGGTEPLAPSAATLVHDGSAYPNAWASGMTLDGTSAPVILYETLDTANGHAYGIVYARYSGGTWHKTTVTTLDDTGLVLIAHSAMEEGGSRVWVVKPVSGVFELFEYLTADNGATFSERQVTSGSTGAGFVYPANAEGGDPRFRGVVLGTDYVFTDNFHVGTYRIGRA